MKKAIKKAIILLTVMFSLFSFTELNKVDAATITSAQIEGAITWAQAHYTEYSGRCLSFVSTAFYNQGLGRPSKGFECPRDEINYLIKVGLFHANDKNPPRGAMVYWDYAGVVEGVYDNYGHVAISLGNGKAVSSFSGGREHSLTVSNMTYRGWAVYRAYDGYSLPNTSSPTKAPDAPTDLKAVKYLTQSATISWKDPSDTNNKATSFIVEYYKRETSSWLKDNDYDLERLTLTSYITTGLGLYDYYDFRITAVNSVGKSAAKTVRYEKNCTVTFNSQGGTAVASKTVANNSKLTKPTDPSKTGYTFGGWYKESTLTNKWDFSNENVIQSMTLYAKWNSQVIQKEYTVKFKKGSKVLKTVSVVAGSGLPSYTPKKSGYTFMGWYTSNKLKTKYDSSKSINSNTVVYARFKKNPAVKFKLNNKVLKTKKTKYNTPVASYIPKKSGYTFIGWYTSKSFKTKYDFNTPVKKNKSLYARFVMNPVAPKSFKVAQQNSTGILVTWTGIGGYYYELEQTYNGSVKTINIGLSNSYTVNGAVFGATYKFRVRAYKFVEGVKVIGKYTDLKNIKLQ